MSWLQEVETSWRQEYWAIFSAQLILGVVFISYSFCIRCFACCKKDKEEGITKDAETPDADEQRRPLTPQIAKEASPTRRASGLKSDRRSKGDLANMVSEFSRHNAFQEHRRNAFERKQSVFWNHPREESNFIRSNDDKFLDFPPASSMEIEEPYSSRFVLCGYFRAVHIRTLLLRSLGWSLIGGSLGTLVCILDHQFNMIHGGHLTWMTTHRNMLGELLSDFKWLPTFMLGGHLAFYVQRWRQFIIAAWSVEGRLKDLGIIIGSDVKNPDDAASRSLMFKFYRYMVVSMALQYKAVLPDLRDAGEDLLQQLVEQKLLLPQEVPLLKPQTSRMRDAVLSWIALEVKNNGPAKKGLLLGNCEISVMDKLTALRAEMMFFHGNRFYPQPNIWAAFMTGLVDTYCALMILIFPITKFVPLEEADYYHGFQPAIILSIFLMTLCFWGALAMAKALSHPFESRFDTFNIDALIAGTEQTLFTSLRASFDDSARTETMGSERDRFR